MSGSCLSSYPFVVVRIACPRCKRHGAYRLARLAAKFGAEAPLLSVLESLSADCPARGYKRQSGAYLVCGAMFPDVQVPRPPDLPPGMLRP